MKYQGKVHNYTAGPGCLKGGKRKKGERNEYLPMPATHHDYRKRLGKEFTFRDIQSKKKRKGSQPSPSQRGDLFKEPGKEYGETNPLQDVLTRFARLQGKVHQIA